MDAHKREIIPLFRVSCGDCLQNAGMASSVLQESAIVALLLMPRRSDPQADCLHDVVLQDTYGQRDTVKWWVRWRVFYLACSELFAFKGGSQWGVGHYVFQKKEGAPRK